MYNIIKDKDIVIIFNSIDLMGLGIYDPENKYGEYGYFDKGYLGEDLKNVG